MSKAVFEGATPITNTVVNDLETSMVYCRSILLKSITSISYGTTNTLLNC